MGDRHHVVETHEGRPFRRGVQSSSEMFRAALDVAQIGQSMSRNLKSEWIYPHGIYETREEAKLSIVEYIEMSYNSERVHQALGYKTPNEFKSEYFDHELELTTVSRQRKTTNVRRSGDRLC